MEYTNLSSTDIRVSRICLGTMTWGEQNTESEAHEQLDYAVDHGVNFIDTAEMYPVPPKAETQGLTETCLGNWLRKHGERDKLVIASKISGPSSWMDWIRDGRIRLDARNIDTALDESLRRLKTDYIDLYQLHWPDRNTNFFQQLGYFHKTDPNEIAIEETLQALDRHVQSGKIRAIGISNETPWGMMKFLQVARDNNLPRIVSIQNPYSLLNRIFEIGHAEISHRENLGLLAYSPLAFGVLTGKYLDGARPAGARLTLYERFDRYSNDKSEAATRMYMELAGDHGFSLAQMALAYVNTRPFVTSNIIGATSLAQLQENIGSIHITLEKKLVQGIESIHRLITNPCP